MRILTLATALCVVQCQARAGMRQLYSTDDMTTTSNHPGDTVSANLKTSRFRNRYPPSYGYGRQDSSNHNNPGDAVADGGAKKGRDDSFPTNDPKDASRKLVKREELAPPDVIYAPKPPRLNSRYLYDSRREDSPMYMNPGEIINDPSGHRNRLTPNGYGRLDQNFPDDMSNGGGTISAIAIAGRRRQVNDDLTSDPDMTRSRNPRLLQYGYPSSPDYSDHTMEDFDHDNNIPHLVPWNKIGERLLRQYSPDDMNVTPNRPWDTRPGVKRAFARGLSLRNNKITSYLISRLTELKDVFDSYDWNSLSAMVDDLVVALKDQQEENQPKVPANSPATVDDNASFYPDNRKYRSETMRPKLCLASDPRPQCLGYGG